MKLKSILTLAVALSSVAAYTTASANEAKDEHKTAEKHSHKHKKNCGHKAEKHGDHEDYEHDGHHHKVHADHEDECSGPEHAEPAAKKS